MTTFTNPILLSNDSLTFTVGGRELHIWVHVCPECTSVDIYTTRGNALEEISANTGDTTRAPMGLMPWRNGARPNVDAEPMEGSHKWPAVSSATLVWHDKEES